MLLYIGGDKGVKKKSGFSFFGEEFNGLTVAPFSLVGSSLVVLRLERGKSSCSQKTKS
jgi:hypothetical protein